jgi:hypothetical protein
MVRQPTTAMHLPPIRRSEIPSVLRRSLFKAILLSAPDPYPLAPEAYEVLVARVSSANTAQSLRGMLRVLSRSIRNLWSGRPGGVSLIEVSHLDFTSEIERLAYYYWEKRGRQEGGSDEDWIRAEREFRSPN